VRTGHAIALHLAALILCQCGACSSATEHPPAVTESLPGEASPETIRWTLQTLMTPSTHYQQAVIDIAESIGLMSNGRLEIEVYPTGAVVRAGEEFEGVDKDVIDACLAGHMNQLRRYPAAGLFYQMVGGMTAAQMQLWYLAGGGDELAATMYSDSNCHYVNTPLVHPPEIWCHSTVPLETVSDLRDLRFRVAGDAREILASMGASTVTFPASDIYEYATRGVVDAFEYGEPAINWEMRLHEVARFLYTSSSRAPTGGNALFVNKASWNDLSPELQAIVEYAAISETQLWYAEELILNHGALQHFIDYGTVVQPLAGAIEAAFLATAEDYYKWKAERDPFFRLVRESQLAFKALCEAQYVS